MSASAPDQTRRRGIWKKLALALLSLVVALLLAEVGTRIFLRVRGKPFDAEEVRNLAANAISMVEANVPKWDAPVEHRANPKQEEVLHPYYGFDASGYIEDVAHLVEYFGSDRAARNYDIAILGGSVASIFASDAAKQLVKGLQVDPRFEARAIRLWSQARGAYKQPQHAIVLQTLLAYGIRFDAVILIDGFNEVAITLQNASFGASPQYPSATKWLTRASNPTADREMMDELLALRAKQSAVTRIARRILDLELQRSALASEIALGSLWRARADAATRFERVTARLSEGVANPSVNGPKFDPDPAAIMRDSVTAWVSGSRSIAAMCREYDMPYLHVLQPTLYDEGSKVLTRDEIAKSKTVREWSEGARIGYPRLRAAGPELTARGIDFYDASLVFADVSETLYYDACHFNARGNEILAEALAARMLEAIRHHDETAPHR